MVKITNCFMQIKIVFNVVSRKMNPPDHHYKTMSEIYAENFSDKSSKFSVNLLLEVFNN